MIRLCKGHASRGSICRWHRSRACYIGRSCSLLNVLQTHLPVHLVCAHRFVEVARSASASERLRWEIEDEVQQLGAALHVACRSKATVFLEQWLSKEKEVRAAGAGDFSPYVRASLRRLEVANRSCFDSTRI